jgi:hypothetical protein
METSAEEDKGHGLQVTGLLRCQVQCCIPIWTLLYSRLRQPPQLESLLGSLLRLLPSLLTPIELNDNPYHCVLHNEYNYLSQVLTKYLGKDLQVNDLHTVKGNNMF